MHTYELTNGIKIDIADCVQAVLSLGEFPIYFFDTQTGDVCPLHSKEALADLVAKIGQSKRYLEITRFDEQDYTEIMKEFLDNIIGMMANKKTQVAFGKVFQSKGWQGVIDEMEKDDEGWNHAWDQFINDEAYDLATDWLMNIPDVKVIEKFQGCDDCPLCQAIKNGTDDVENLKNIFETQNKNEVKIIQEKPEMQLQLKIELVGSKPLIWRRILVPSNYSFYDLHIAIQDAFGWLDCHLHQFSNKNPYSRKPEQTIYIKYPHPEDNEDFFGKYRNTYLNETTIELVKFLDKEGVNMWYEYDFGDGWIHKITLEKILPHDSKSELPKILKGANACPPEDSGGLSGYYHMLEVLKNPKHKEYTETLEWFLEFHGYTPEEDYDLKDLIDPTFFNIEEIEFSDPKESLEDFEHFSNF